jgi:ABC-type Fe3+-citrate transport system substrate-binding protein
MKKIMIFFGTIMLALLIFSSCSNNQENKQTQSTEIINDKQTQST